jgi:glycosyltransferase involved in cell wall biosynthesis
MTIVFVVNGGPQSAMGIRARSFEARLRNEFEIQIDYRYGNKVYAIIRTLLQLMKARPALCYVFDMGYSGVLAAGLYRMFSGCRVVVDTGDAIYELSRSVGSRGPLGLWLTKWLERYSLRISDRVVVRSHPHQELLASQGIGADAIPDGVDLDQFFPRAEGDLRKKYGLAGFTVLGILGSLVWNPRLEMCYGWEVIEVIHRLRDRPLKGLVIGDGTGLAQLKARCTALGLEDRVVFAGRIPYNDLPQYLNLMDVCLSTQTNDIVGQVRTTGKLPLYLACGRFVLATEVGEAARVLPPRMLVTYNGTKDPEYPARLAERVQALLEHPERLQQHMESVAIARSHFDYNRLAGEVGQIIQRLLPPQSANQSVSGLTAEARPGRATRTR